MKRISQLSITLMALALLVVLALALFPSDQPASAAPAVAPTPIANTEADGSSRYLNVTFQEATALTADTNTSGKQLPGYEYIDLQTTIDQGTTNTATLTIQFSNDNTNWDNGPAIVTANAADVTEMTRIPLFGRYVRINQDVTNSNPLTVTLIAVAK